MNRFGQRVAQGAPATPVFLRRFSQAPKLPFAPPPAGPLPFESRVLSPPVHGAQAAAPLTDFTWVVDPQAQREAALEQFRKDLSELVAAHHTSVDKAFAELLPHATSGMASQQYAVFRDNVLSLALVTDPLRVHEMLGLNDTGAAVFGLPHTSAIEAYKRMTGGSGATATYESGVQRLRDAGVRAEYVQLAKDMLLGGGTRPGMLGNVLDIESTLLRRTGLSEGAATGPHPASTGPSRMRTSVADVEALIHNAADATLAVAAVRDIAALHARAVEAMCRAVKEAGGSAKPTPKLDAPRSC